MSIMYRQPKNLQRFPSELFKHLSQSFNGVVGANIIIVKNNEMRIEFDKFAHSNTALIVNLYTKLVNSFTSINKKYLKLEKHQRYIQLRMKNDLREYYLIQIFGFIHIPPGKILKLFSLILWYYIKYISGTSPKNSIYGRELMNKWKNEEKFIRRNLLMNSMKQIEYSDIELPCHICGEMTNYINKWTFRYAKEHRDIDVETRVCMKHKYQIL